RLHANDTFDDEFLVALGRGCPELTSLAFSGAYELVDLRNEPGVVFPRLQRLEIGNVTTNVPWMTDEAELSPLSPVGLLHGWRLMCFTEINSQPTLQELFAVTHQT
ncbi:hypothetical protein KCU73_g12135, partial [Aureobasidium melanogenum]